MDGHEVEDESGTEGGRTGVKAAGFGLGPWASVCGVECDSRIRPKSVRRNLVFLEPPVERRAAQAERLGHLTDVPAVVLQRLHDHRLLDLVHRHAADRRQRVAPASPAAPFGRRPEVDRLRAARVRTSTVRSTDWLSCLMLPGQGCAAATRSPRRSAGSLRAGRPAPWSAAKRVGEDRDVVSPIAKRRQVNRDQVDAIQQVLAELPRADHLGQIAVGRGRRRARPRLRCWLSRAPRSSGPAARAASSPATRDRGRRSRRERSSRRAPARSVPCDPARRR